MTHSIQEHKSIDEGVMNHDERASFKEIIVNVEEIVHL